MNLMNVRGTEDFLSKEMILRNRITDILKNNFEKYGYMPLETPIINYFDLLKYKYTENAEILKEIYRFTDQGDRDLGLRYDLTVPFCKVVALTKDLVLPFRRYEIGKVFRNGPIKAGRSREFYQCDVDVVGIDNRCIEAEQMKMVVDTFNDLGIEIVIKYNNRKLLSGIIEYIGIDNSLIDEVIGIIDKKEKISANEFKSLLNEILNDNNKVDELLIMLDKNINEYKEYDNELIQEGVNELIELNEYLDSLEITSYTKFTPTLARGLSIYTGVVFEFFDKKNRISSSLGGGGRYNKIITNFIDDGKEYPAIGLSFGLEPIYVVLKDENKNVNSIDMFIVPLNTSKQCLNIASLFRKNGYKVLLEMNGKRVSRCFEFAERENIRYVMIVGDNEVNSNIYKIKDMYEKKEYEVSYDELISFISSR